MAEPTLVTLRLHPDAVVAPTLRAVEQSVSMVNFYMQSLDSADLSRAPEFAASNFQMTFKGKEISAEERRTHYTNWVLSKGFQDLARGVRGMLEEAYLYITVAKLLSTNAPHTTTWLALQKTIKSFRKEAADAKFPELMEAVNKGLTSRLHFEKEFLSLQKIRNCLEHRDGIVGERDIDDHATSLKLALPQLKISGEDGRQLGRGSFVEKDTKIIFKNEIKEREFKLGERIVFDPKEFNDISYGCWAFASDVGSKLPPVEPLTETRPLTAPDRTDRRTEEGQKQKTNKLKARLPSGLADRSPTEIAATGEMVEKIRLVFERYGFEPVETPAIEYTDALGKFLPDQDRPNEGVFSFKDDDDQWLSLRYDLTAPLARYVAQNFQTVGLPYRSYRYGYVFRNEKPGPGRFRQFMQFDADTVGSASMAADAEMCMLAADTMEALGIPRGSYVVKLNSRKILDGVMDAANIAADNRLTVLRAIDKLDRLGVEGVRQLLGTGRKDESGDYTKGANLSAEQIEFVENLWRDLPGNFVKLGAGTFATEKATDAGDARDMEPTGPFEYISNIRTLEAWEQIFSQSPLSLQAIGELKEIVRNFESAGYGSKRIRVDSSVVRGLEYYTGPVYEAELTFETRDDKGRPARFGSVGGGGRYDGLVSRFMGQPVPATGFSIGVSRLRTALTALGKIVSAAQTGPVVVTVFDKDRVADYQRMVAALRNAGIRAEMYLGNPKNIGNQLKYADKRRAPCVVIQGGDEKAKGEVLIKDLARGAALARGEADRGEYLEKQSEAQVSVPEAKLVETVQAILARQKKS